MNVHDITVTFFIVVSVLSKEFLSCGTPLIKDSKGRIINGEIALPNSWPWMVSIRHISPGSKTFYHTCGGSLISPNFVLTTAHCVLGRAIESLSATIGSNYLDENNQTFYSFSEIFVHPDYEPVSKGDIALLKLKNRIEFKENISPICLPTSSNVSVIFNQTVVVLGWGSTSGENALSKLSNRLLQASLKIQNEVKPSICKDFESFFYCALDPSTKKSNICFGDSGGPLMFFKDEKCGDSSSTTTQVMTQNILTKNIWDPIKNSTMSYECAGGSLKLKGVSDKKIKKKKKSKIDPEALKQELLMPKVSKPEFEDSNSNSKDSEIKSEKKSTKTKAELAFERLQEKRNQEKILQRAEKSHKERVELYNKHLDSLTEYNDIPKVSWTK
ncbi:unnamed protein product [Brachionus calyciflorus]|uniref:Peptidase S1 domain-containing protein n=1 Tax=Brachionus calyciflorus TaxID=104777 RepID=A0A813T2F0_9BILA|nr:unnamed protein product [Brachionus calyciflorus]